MTGPLQFDNKVSLGNLLTMAGFAVAVIIAYSDLRASQTQQMAAIDAVARAAEQREARVRNVEIAQASQSSDLRAILLSISRIETQLNKMQEVRP